MRYEPPAFWDVALSDEAERLLWRKSLTEDQVRSMAVDYKRGMIDQCNADAYEEFCERFPHEVDGSKKKTKRDKKRGKERRASRYT